MPQNLPVALTSNTRRSLEAASRTTQTRLSQPSRNYPTALRPARVCPTEPVGVLSLCPCGLWLAARQGAGPPSPFSQPAAGPGSAGNISAGLYRWTAFSLQRLQGLVWKGLHRGVQSILAHSRTHTTYLWGACERQKCASCPLFCLLVHPHSRPGAQ